VKAWAYARQAEADLAASRETIEELLALNSRQAEQAAAVQAAAVAVRSGKSPAPGLGRRPLVTSSAVEYSRHHRSSAAGVAPMSARGRPAGRADVSSRPLDSSDDSDDESGGYETLGGRGSRGAGTPLRLQPALGPTPTTPASVVLGSPGASQTPMERVRSHAYMQQLAQIQIAADES
jgi:hypothetical protein